MRNYCFLSLLLVFSAFAGCQKPVADDPATIISGYVQDTVRNVRLADVTVIIKGCNTLNNKYVCSDSLTSVKTDANGEFSLSLPTDLRNVNLLACVQSDKNFEKGNTIRLKPSADNSVKLTAVKKLFLKGTIKISSNTLDSIFVLTPFTSHKLYGKSIDTTIYFRVLPNNKNYIFFSAPDRTDAKKPGSRILKDSIQVALKDTIQYSKTIADVKLLPFYQN